MSMKILLITEMYYAYPKQNRKETTYVVSNLMSSIANRGHKVFVIRPYRYFSKVYNLFKKARVLRRFSKDEIFEVDDVSIYRLGISSVPKKITTRKQVEELTPKVYKFVELFDPDLILVHMIEPSLHIANNICINVKNLPIILTLHNTDLYFLNKYSSYKLPFEAFRNVKKIGFSSEIIKKKFFEINLKSTSNIRDHFINKYGVNETWFRNICFKDLDYNKQKLITVCYLHKSKRIDFLINALKSYRQEISLSVVGDGPEKKRLLRLAKKTKFDKNVLFIGEVDNNEIIQLLDNSDVFVLLSYPETLGLVYIEAMARGKIVIGSEGQGIDGVIINGANGFLCDPTNRNQFLSILNYIYNPKNLIYINKIRKNAMKTAINYSSKNVANEYIYEIENTII